MANVRCDKCSHYNKSSNEYRVSDEFVSGASYHNGIKFPSCEWQSVGGISMCNHPDCFSYDKEVDPVHGKRYNKKRVKGQGQFNKDNDCSNFKNAWWRFWVRNKGASETEVFLDQI